MCVDFGHHTFSSYYFVILGFEQCKYVFFIAMLMLIKNGMKKDIVV
jgi:hypothetical protein